jgi:hypothetical protein
VHEHANISTVANAAEADLAAGMGGEVQSGTEPCESLSDVVLPESASQIDARWKGGAARDRSP